METTGFVIEEDTRCWGSCQGLALAIPLTLLVVTTPIICCLMCIKSIQKRCRARRELAPSPPSRSPCRKEVEKMLERPVFTAPLVVAMVDENKKGLPTDYERASLPEYQENGDPETMSKCDEAQE